MQFELQKLTLQSRALATVEALIEKTLQENPAPSTLSAIWRTEVGVLNQLVLLWSLPHLSVKPNTQQTFKDHLNALCDPYLHDHSSNLWTAADFSPPLTPRSIGALYEIRQYTYTPGKIPEVIQAWEEIIGERVKHSPLIAAGYREEGPEHQWIHIWGYQDIMQREQIRRQVSALGIWPISVVDRRLQRPPRAVSERMENTLVVPLHFSPIR
jgi:hypothetical protein